MCVFENMTYSLVGLGLVDVVDVAVVLPLVFVDVDGGAHDAKSG